MRDMSSILVSLALVAVWATADAQDREMLQPDDRPTVVLGASYAASWSIDKLSGRRIINKGVDGNQSHEMSDRFTQDVLLEEPAQVLVWGFINDIFRSEPDNYEATKQRVLDEYLKMIEAAEANSIEVIIATEVTIREPSGFSNWIASIIGRALGKKSYQDMINGHVVELNAQLSYLAQTYGITVLDFQSLLADTDGKRRSEFAIDDGSHLTERAYDVLTKFTKETLDAHHSAQEVK